MTLINWQRQLGEYGRSTKDDKRKLHTKSNKIFEALKSRYMTGFSSSWRKVRPFAAPIAIFILVNHGKVAE